jgi:hypothetical protein
MNQDPRWVLLMKKKQVEILEISRYCPLKNSKIFNDFESSVPCNHHGVKQAHLEIREANPIVLEFTTRASPWRGGGSSCYP